MSHPFCLVVNPAASRGRSARRLPEVLGVLSAGGAAVRVCESASLSHAARLAEEATGLGEVVVAVGGDGIVGALAGAVSQVGGTLGVIPAGRGNDFARMLGIPTGPAAAATALLEGRPRPVDLIGVQTGYSPEEIVAGSVYLGVVSVGGEIANRSRWVAGPLGYQLAGVRALLGWRPATFTVDCGPDPGPPGPPGPAGPARSFPGFCVIVANSVYLAAGKKAAPDADIDDGLLDVIMVDHASKMTFVKVMLQAGSGTHVQLSQVSTRRAAAVTVTTDRAMPAAADGETLACASPLGAGSALRIRALPGALRVITPVPVVSAAEGHPSAERMARPWPPPRKESTNSGLADNSAGVPSIRTSPPPST
jgi:diacylglycerol kinase (ATP)